ncbi:MAG: homoserine dehydrogenase [Caldilineaceae bacterium]
MREIRLALVGLGAVNRSLLTILARKAEELQRHYQLTFRVVLIADSSGAARRPSGFDPVQLCTYKANGGRVCDLEDYRDTPVVAELSRATCDVVMEASPVNLQHGEPGLSITRAALQQGISVVLANKGPLVLAYLELDQLAKNKGAGLAYSATVCGALPVINIGRRDLVAAEIRQLRGIFNSTTNFILAEMTQGESFAAALQEAQRRGIAESDPTLDVGGWDTANKLVIIANSVLGFPATLADVAVKGIAAITTEQLQAELQQGRTIKLVATAQQTPQGYQLTVAPTVLAQQEFLGGCSGWEMGVEIQSDLYGTLYHKIWEDSPIPTAAAMLRDAVNLFINKTG